MTKFRLLLIGTALGLAATGCGRKYVVGLNEGSAGGSFGSGGTSASGEGGRGGADRPVVGLSFRGALSYPGGSRPSGLAFGDVNGDGRADLIVADYGDQGPNTYGDARGNGGMSVLLNRGDGTFAEPLTLLTNGSASVSPVLLDFNGDGKPDLATNDGAGVALFRNDGGGTFSSPMRLSLPAGPVDKLAASDLNGDGWLDLVVAGGSSVASGDLYVCLGTGTGDFGAATKIGSNLKVLALTVQDLDGDLKADLVVQSPGMDPASPADLTVRLGNGDGTFRPAVHYLAGDATITPTLSIGDLNGDGRPDIVSANSAKASVLLNQGGGGFAAAVNYSGGPSGLGPAVLRDLDGDGKPDLAAVNTNGVSLLRGVGDGSFAAAVELPPAGGGGSRAIAAADVDGDGNVDLVVSSRLTNRVIVIPGRGHDTFLVAPNHSSPGAMVALADLDGDGKLDLASANGRLGVYLGNGDGSFGASGQDFAAGAGANSLAVGDVNGDGVPDLAVSTNDNGGQVNLFFASGRAMFVPATSYATPDAPRSVTLADLDGDGHLDLAVANMSGGNIYVLRNRGAGTTGSFAAPVPYPVGLLPDSIAAGDVNGDGKLDLVVANENNGTASVLLNAGDGTFAAASTIPVGTTPIATALADLDGDGHLDIAFAVAGGGSVILGNGTGTFTSPVTYPAGTSSASIAVGDLDGDGLPDLAITDSIADEVSLFLGRASGAFGAPVRYATGPRPTSVAMGDLDGDGRRDLVVGTSIGATILLNDSHRP